jgi:predicted nuclease of predicted toxin-antitoxin system
MKFRVDVGVGKKVENWLRRNGFDVLSVRDMDPCAKDSQILRWVVDQQRMIISMDKDFGELVYNSGKHHAGVLILRLEDADGATKVEITKKILAEYCDRIESHFCVFQNGKLRIRGS